MDAAEMDLFEDSVRRATERHTGEALDVALEELGWRDALVDDPHTAVSILFPVQGGANVASSALDQVVLTGLGLSVATAEAVVLPSLGSSDPPGAMDGDRLSVRGLGTARLQRCDRAVVVTRAAGGTSAVTVATSDLTVRPVGGIDPDYRLMEVTADAAGSTPCPDPTGDAWARAVMLAQLALSHEILGAARTMLALAREHALDRVQFGQSISRFQAVRHRLADTLVVIEAADAVVTAAGEAPSPELAAAAKSLAGRGAMTAARHCQQVLAGIGFTSEHPFHRHYRRVLLLDQLFGSAHSLTRECGELLLRSRELPAFLPL